jgi:hypothetical protein
MAEADLMVFVHIPKCAGTALNTWLSNSHHYGNLYVKLSDVRMNALRWQDISPLDLRDPRMRSVASHHLRTYPETIEGRTLRYITILREPILRWISDTRYFGRMNAEDGTPRLTLREYAEWMLDQPATEMLELINGQTNFIAEHEWFRRERHESILIDWNAEPDLFARYTRERLALARDLLRSFPVVGTVDRLTDFTHVLQARAPAWDVPLIPVDGLEPKLVTIAPAVNLDWIVPADSVGRRLLDAFAEDFELYRLASELIASETAKL